jgi:hypothetical protein
MKKLLACSAISVLSLAILTGSAAQAEERMLSHDVFFTLKDKSPEGKAKLVAACKKYLSGHPGTVWFAVGPRAEEFQRDVNDFGFDVALHLVFKDKGAHDVYQKAERHQKFIQEAQGLWEKVRVFDSYLDATSHDAMKQPAHK